MTWADVGQATDVEIRRDLLAAVDRLDVDEARKEDLRAYYRTDAAITQLRTDAAKRTQLYSYAELGRRQEEYVAGVHAMHEALYSEDIARGRKVKRGAQDGGHLRQGDYTVRPAKLQEQLAAKMARNPDLSLTQARAFVAKEAGLSPRTVRSHTRWPTPVELEQARKK